MQSSKHNPGFSKFSAAYIQLQFRLRLFWLQTISGNHFTPHRIFGCAWKIKFSGKAFHLTVK